MIFRATSTKHKSGLNNAGWGSFNGYNYIALVSNNKTQLKKLLKQHNLEHINIKDTPANYFYFVSKDLHTYNTTAKYIAVFLDTKNDFMFFEYC